MIPKRIHYCWFGGRPLPLQARLCLASWRYHLPDYELVLWDERSFDPRSHPFTAAAYRAGRHAFVSDYVRMQALALSGGIYMDVDVEVLARFDELLDSALLIGLEDQQRFATSLVGSEPGHWLAEAMLEYYQRTAFDPTKLSELVNVNEVSRLLLAHGFDGKRGQSLARERVMPIGAFADARGQAKDVKGVARHLYAGTWRDARGKSWLSRLARVCRRLPEQFWTWCRLQRYQLAIALRD